MIKVYGHLVDEQTRCVHYRTPLDVVAIQFKCCGRYYACYQCHEASEPHEAVRWATAEFEQRALLCGVCKGTLTITDYLGSGFACVRCQAPFNPGCASHRELYFSSK